MSSPYETYNDRIGVRLSFIVSDEDRRADESLQLIGYKAYLTRALRNKSFRLKEGKGLGNEALIYWEAMPRDWQAAFIEQFGNPKQTQNPLTEFFEIDAEAKRFFDTFRFPDQSYLKPEQIERYTTNASVLNALGKLKTARETSRKMRGGSLKNVWASLIRDVVAFNDTLKTKHSTRHTLPESDKLKQKFNTYQKLSYCSLVDGRNKNQAAQVVTPEMISLWKDIYAGQRGQKPNHLDVYRVYLQFLSGRVDIVSNETGELYDRESEKFNQVSDKTVYAYQTAWEHRIVTHALRSGDRQKFKSQYEPWHKLKQPEFAGSIISIDDRQPPFEYAAGKRMWFYNAIDLGSEAFTCWVWGETKEGIILDFYRQLVRNYTAWGWNLPYELEGELSLNSSFKDSFLQPGAMFQAVRIEANNARGKRIEAYYRPLRYGLEKKREGWLARPFAIDESNQAGPLVKTFIPQTDIVNGCQRDIRTWNNTLHSNQALYPGMTRWEVACTKQHPQLVPTNWAGILPYLGYKEVTSMRAGRITLQYKHRVVGFNGKVAIGEELIGIMKRIEGQEVTVYWLDGHKGDVLKALVYTMEGQMICELLGDLSYSRSTLETTPEDEVNRALMSAYTTTVQGYVRREAKEIDRITIIENEQPSIGMFNIPGLDDYDPAYTEAETLPNVDEDFNQQLMSVERPFKTSTASRF
ncbi:MAG TPA: hypothetical protein DIW47_11005 [Bacteroidetes bacterium]|nr:hypothetical protein [Bacteroidota bacterium]